MGFAAALPSVVVPAASEAHCVLTWLPVQLLVEPDCPVGGYEVRLGCRGPQCFLPAAVGAGHPLEQFEYGHLPRSCSACLMWWTIPIYSGRPHERSPHVLGPVLTTRRSRCMARCRLDVGTPSPRCSPISMTVFGAPSSSRALTARSAKFLLGRLVLVASVGSKEVGVGADGVASSRAMWGPPGRSVAGARLLQPLLPVPGSSQVGVGLPVVIVTLVSLRLFSGAHRHSCPWQPVISSSP